jgi:hypothetical protein
LFIITGKARAKENTDRLVSVESSSARQPKKKKEKKKIEKGKNVFIGRQRSKHARCRGAPPGSECAKRRRGLSQC